AWYLQLRNIYRFPGSGLDANDFTLDIFYEPPGKTASERLPGVGGAQTLLQILRLDRLNEQGAPSPDNAFDFVPGITIQPGDGLLIFPTLEPFGRDLAETIAGDDGSVSSAEQELINQYVFEELYTIK